MKERMEKREREKSISHQEVLHPEKLSLNPLMPLPEKLLRREMTFQD